MFSKFQRLFRNRRHAHFIDYLAEINSGISAVALFPQVFSLLSGHASDGLSPLSFFLIALNSMIWFVYGVHRKTPPLIISSSLNAMASIGILILIALKR